MPGMVLSDEMCEDGFGVLLVGMSVLGCPGAPLVRRLWWVRIPPPPFF